MLYIPVRADLNTKVVKKVEVLERQRDQSEVPQEMVYRPRADSQVNLHSTVGKRGLH